MLDKVYCQVKLVFKMHMRLATVIGSYLGNFNPNSIGMPDYYRNAAHIFTTAVLRTLLDQLVYIL